MVPVGNGQVRTLDRSVKCHPSRSGGLLRAYTAPNAYQNGLGEVFGVRWRGRAPRTIGTMESWSTTEELTAAAERIESGLDGYVTPAAYGVGIATVSASGTVLDTWYPHVNSGEHRLPAAVMAEVCGYRSTTSTFTLSAEDLKTAITNLTPAEAATDRPHHNMAAWRAIAGLLEAPISGGRSRVAVAAYIASHDDAPVDIHDAYLRLHLLSHRVVAPNTTSMEGIFGKLANAVWTNDGPFEPESFAVTKAEVEATGARLTVLGVDKFPRMLDYVVPTGVRIADASRVRLGAHLAEGTVVMHEGYCNFNAGTMGQAMVEGRISQGVVVQPESDIGGGASIMGTLSGGGKEVITIGSGCLVGANAGIGISLGNGCTVEAGLYVTAGTIVTREDGTKTKALELSGADNVLFRRSSVTGAVEAIEKAVTWGGLNTDLH